MSSRPRAGARAGDAAPHRPAWRSWALPAVSGRWLAVARSEAAAVAALTVAAALLRLWSLGTVPLGLHGDEAWTGIDARRILDEGWIGPYTDAALGQPTGPLYVTALLFSFLPETTWTIRFSMAIFGVATIPLAYLAFRTMFGRTVATFAALLLTFMVWHLHLSRTGFMVTTWPFIEVATLFVLFQALRTRSALLFGLAGLLAGLGLYTYNAYLLFLPVIAVPVVVAVIRERDPLERRQLALMSAIFGLVALLVALPMLDYAINNWEDYRFHQDRVSLLESDAWADAGVAGKAELIVERTGEWLRGLTIGGRADLGDGLATDGHPVVGPLVMALAAVGLGFAVVRARRPEYAVLVAGALVLPLGAILTIEDGLFRRTFGLAPIVAVLAAIPLAAIWEQLSSRRERGAIAGLAIVVAAVGLIAAKDVYDYFGPVQDTEAMRFVYPAEIDAAAHYVDDLPPGVVVYFYSDRWSINYETAVFIAPDPRPMFDRSIEFRDFPAPETDDAVSLDIERTRASGVAMVFTGNYLPFAEEAARRYPGGALTERTHEGRVLFLAYYLPPDEDATDGETP